MTREEYIKHLISIKGYSIKSFASDIDMPYSTLLSMLNGSIGGAAVDNVIKICQGLGITINELQNCGKSADEDIVLNKKEKMIVIAYRHNEDMQPAVDRLLAIDEIETDIIPSLVAARSKNNDEPIHIELLPDLSKFPKNDTDL